MDALEALLTRRSVRRYTAEPVTVQEIETLLEAGRWSPSGLNNQPWRFLVLFRGDARIESIAALSKYGKIIRSGAAVILVLLARDKMYNPMKDYQGAGACLENILLAAHATGLGAVWLGETTNHAPAIMSALNLSTETHEYMAAVVVGRPAAQGSSQRVPLAELLIEELPHA